LIISHFAEEEFEAIAAASPEEAVAFCAANHVSAIVMDSEFVTEGGWTVAQSLRMVKPQLPIVLLKAGHGRELPPHVDAVACKVEMILCVKGPSKTMWSKRTPRKYQAGTIFRLLR
jgi:CheY-like chemotaxis protein